jgi:hypothetical protein
VTEQGYPPRQPEYPGRPRVPNSPRHHEPRSGWQTLDAFDDSPDLDDDLPPWAGPGIEPVRPARRKARGGPPERSQTDPDGGPAESDLGEDEQVPRAPRRAAAGTKAPGRDGDGRGRSRAAATRRRRSKRRLVTWGSVAVVVVIVAAAGYYISRPGPQPRAYVTSLQKGEYSSVPNACKLISDSALSQYLGGTPSKGVQYATGGGKSECTYQFDAKPTFRVLDITVTAYPPSLIAPGNGSATSYATYTFAQTRQVFLQPPKHTPEPPAKVTSIRLGNRALGAVQIYHIGPVQDRATVVTQWHNVLITLSLWATDSGGFGPVSIPQLLSDALAAARTTLAVVQSRPAVS